MSNIYHKLKFDLMPALCGWHIKKHTSCFLPVIFLMMHFR